VKLMPGEHYFLNGSLEITGRSKELIISGFKSAFLPHREKADLLKKVTLELGQFVPQRRSWRGRPHGNSFSWHGRRTSLASGPLGAVHVAHRGWPSVPD